jgi:UDP-glucuronate 4-epimerase
MSRTNGNARALVTGCAGFIGSHLTESLLSEGVAVVGVDCFNENYGRRIKLRNLERARDWDTFDFVPIDLSRGELAELVGGVDTVYHLAAEPGVRASWGGRFETYVRNNVLATQHVLEAARGFPEVRVVYASSSSVYGHAESYPTNEALRPRPFSPYGVTKLAAEHLCQLYTENLGLETVSLRFFSVYGPRQRPDMAFTRFCRAALLGEPISIYGDGNQIRDFTYVDDVVAAVRAAAEQDRVAGNVYNVGGGSEITVRETLDVLTSLVGHDLEIHYTSAERGDVRQTGADISSARANLGFSPTVDVREGLSRQLDWARDAFASK